MSFLHETESYQYWTNLVVGSDSADVDEVGHPDMGREFNLAAYSLRLRAVGQALEHMNCDLARSSVFEAGFGVGFYLQFWKTAGCRRVVGGELSPRACSNVKTRFPQFDLRTLDIAALHREDDWAALVNSFNLVTLIDVLYHIMDDKGARQALENVAGLVSPGGALILTEKFPETREPVSESQLVRRRPYAWYAEVLGGQGFKCSDRIPIFWCMDPPVFNAGQRAVALAGYGMWGMMRLALKYHRRSTHLQNKLGRILGRAGARVDRMVVERMRKTPNLTMAVFRRL
jgi:hypothetical protein